MAAAWRPVPPGGILPGSSEKTHATARAPAGQDLAERGHRQWVPHRVVDDESGGRSNSQDFSPTVPFQHRWPIPPPARVDAPEARTTCFRVQRTGHRALEAERLAAGKKNAARLGAHLVFADESGFLLAPLVAKTWAPRGCTPFQRHPHTYLIIGDNLSQRRTQPVFSGYQVPPYALICKVRRSALRRRAHGKPLGRPPHTFLD